MKKIKKLTAVVLALVAVSASMSNVVANAVEKTEAPSKTKMAIVEAEVKELVRKGEISETDAEKLIKRIEMVSTRDTTYAFPSYLSLPSNFVSVDGVLQDNYVTFFTNNTLYSTYFRYIINNNIGTSNPASLSNYSKLYNNVSLANLTHLSSEDTTDGKCYSIYLGISGSLSSNKSVFSLNLGNTFSSTIGSPAALRSNIRDRDNYTSNPFPTQSSTSLNVGLYTVGDVTRDGVINQADADYLLAYIVETLQSDGSKNEEIFKLAGDIDGNKKITILDVIAINDLIS
jgi:hypothetical protein